jgi:H+/Cl- antiporter ClcA
LLFITLLPLFSSLLPMLFVIAVLFGLFRYILKLLPSWFSGGAGRYLRNSFRDYNNRAGRRDSRGE